MRLGVGHEDHDAPDDVVQGNRQDIVEHGQRAAPRYPAGHHFSHSLLQGYQKGMRPDSDVKIPQNSQGKHGFLDSQGGYFAKEFRYGKGRLIMDFSSCNTLTFTKTSLVQKKEMPYCRRFVPGCGTAPESAPA